MNTERRGRSLYLGILAAGLCGSLCASLTWAGTIVGTRHDFSIFGWNADGQICIFCHTPHNADTTVSNVPLWNHALTTQSYTLYDSPTFQGEATVGQPGSNSILCLSCHDGTVAVDSYGGAQGTNFLRGNAAIGSGGDLSDSHPISFVYDSSLAIADGSLHDPASQIVTIGSADKVRTGLVQDVLLFDARMECASCHDVHNTFTQSDPLLKITSNGSELCLACHNK
jgi:predicted CXXCH cytochrome family protein